MLHRFLHIDLMPKTSPVRGLSVQARLVLLVLVSIVPLVAFGAYMIDRRMEAQRGELQEEVRERARTLAAAVDRELDGSVATLQLLALSPALRKEDYATFRELIDDALKLRPTATGIVLLDTTGQVLVTTLKPFGEPLPRRTDLETLNRVLATGQPQISGLVTAAVMQRPIISIEVPVFRDGRIVNVLAMGMTPDRLSKVLADQHLPAEWYAAIFDRKAVATARTRDLDRFLGKPASPGIQAKLAESDSEAWFFPNETSEGTPVYTTLARSASSGWTVSIGVPREVVDAPLRRSVWLAGAGGFGLIVASIVAAMWVGRRISRPVRSLAAPALALGRGEMPDDPLPGVREVQEVGKALRAAAATMRQRILQQERAEESQRESEQHLREERRVLEILNRTGAALAGELDLERLVQLATDAGTELAEAQFGAFFYNRIDRNGESYTLYALSGVPRSAFAGFPMPRNTALFGPTFRGEGVVRIADVRQDPRFGANAPYNGLPQGHLPVRSYLAAPVISRSGETIGGLFFGHAEPGVFTERAERLIVGIASQAAVAIDNARLYEAAQREVAERRRAEEELVHLAETLEQRVEERTRELSASQARLRAFQENSPDWLSLQRVTPDGGVFFVDVNPAAAAGYGLPPEQVIGRAIEDILGAEQAQVPLHYARECVRTNSSQHYLARRTLAGRTRTLDVLAVPVPDVDKTPGEHDRLLIMTARDLTEREALEEQLRQAQKMEAVGQLTGGVAHDFNNLLAAVLGNIELAHAKVQDEFVRTLLARATRSAQRGAKLTEQLLAFSRKQHLQPKSVEIGELVPAMAEMLERTIGPLVRIETKLQPGQWPTLVDPTQFELVLLNLALNARDAMPLGGQLLIEAVNVPAGSRNRPAGLTPGTDYICLSVSDTGTGMSEDVAGRAFEPFFTTKEIGKGSGLGLSQVYGVAQQSGGTATIESRIGEGTTVRVYLPRAKSLGSVPGSGGGGEHALATSPRTADGAGTTILVVDDDQDVRTVAATLLDELGYRVLEAADGRAAMAIVERAERIDLLLADYAMRGMTGLDLADQAQARRPGLPVVLITGYAEMPDAAGVLDRIPVLGKPFKLGELAAAIRSALPETRGGGSADGRVVSLRRPEGRS